MSSSEFSAYYVERDAAGAVRGGIKSISRSNLPPGNVLMEAKWSSLNYKDALAATGHPGVARRLPHVPGIDVAGIITELSEPAQSHGLKVGDEVLVTGYELGAGQWGGWSEYVQVPAEWVIPRPHALTLRDTMALGTAGFTAAQCVEALEHHGIQPGADIVVTGSTGGVGCVAVMLLGKLGYRVFAVTGKSALESQIKDWGAVEVLGRDAVIDEGPKPLLPGRWAGAVDTVGGKTLGTIIRQTKDLGCVTACGLVGGTDLPVSVYPFILRGVTLAGVTSSGCPHDKRVQIWERLATEWRVEKLPSVTTEVSLQEVGDVVPEILAGKVVGRTVVRI